MKGERIRPNAKELNNSVEMNTALLCYRSNELGL